MTLNNESLRKLRTKVGFSQETMADLMKIGQATYNRLENGNTKLKMEHIPKIAAAIKNTEEEVLSKLSGCQITTTNNDNAQNNQNSLINVLNVSDKELLQSFIESQTEQIRAKDVTIQSQALTINFLQAELNRLKNI